MADAAQGNAGRTSKWGDQLSNVEVVFSSEPKQKQFTTFVCQDNSMIKQWLTRGKPAKKLEPAARQCDGFLIRP
jgi:hypothetical protein